jgi:outer membrane protein W
MAVRRPRRSCSALARAAVLGGCLATTAALAQTAEPGWGERFLKSFNETTSVGMIPEAERRDGWKGWFADAWDGSKRIFRDGHTDLMLPLYTFHPPYEYPNRDDQNHYPWGGGIARTWIDGRDNERLLYAMAFSDSHYDFEPAVGYAWIARWPLFGTVKGGLGYTVFVTMRSDANYIPFPAILPLASIGTDRFTLYGTWVPSSDVLFFFARISLPYWDSSPVQKGQTGGGLPLGAAGEQRFRPNLVYASAAYVNTDAGGIDTVASDNDLAPMLGYRRFFTENIALDVSASRSRHTLDYGGARIGSFDYVPITVAAQYHLPAYRGLRMYAGVGVTYSRMSDQDLPGYSLSGTSISPAVQAGLSYAVTDAIVLTGGVAASFPRNELKQEGSGLGTLTLSPVTFTIGVGFSF